MTTVSLIHWKEAELPERAERLRGVGFAVIAEPLDGPGWMRQLKADPPDAVVIDLSRLPSHGREVGHAIRQGKATRQVPLVFVDGDPVKVERIRGELPDAEYSNWNDVGPAVRRAIASAPSPPVVPRAHMDRYADSPLVKKLGIKAGQTIVLVSAPDDFLDTLGELPKGVKIRRQLRGNFDLVIWFVDSQKQFDRRIDSIADRTPSGGTWIAWPKKASGVKTDVTSGEIRRLGLLAELVDYKVCSIDSTWSGLKFARRKS